MKQITTDEKIHVLANVLRQTIQQIKGIKMTNDFDFDALLDDIDNIETVPTKEPEVPSDVTETTQDDIDSLLDETITEPKETSPVYPDEPDVKAASEVQAVDEVLDDLEVQEQAIRKQKKVLTNKKSEIIADKIDYEYASEAKSFLKAYDELEMEKQELQERMRKLKKEYEEAGVEVKTVLKARAEVIKELKETETESKLIQDMKKMIAQDDVLMGNATHFAG